MEDFEIEKSSEEARQISWTLVKSKWMRDRVIRSSGARAAIAEHPN